MTAEAERHRRESEAPRHKALVTMADTIEAQTSQVVERVAHESGRVNDTAGRMAQSAILVEENAQRVAAEQSLANAQAVAGASEELSASIREIASLVARSKDIAASVAAAVEEQDAATKEIARNVQQSAQAAEEGTERIVAVASEAAATGQQAGTVETLLGAMVAQVAELGHVLTRVVRTATPDVNRRANPRFAIRAKARLASRQGEVEGGLADISVGGARVTGMPDAASPGAALAEPYTLKLDDVQVPVTVIEAKGGVCRVRIAGDRDGSVGRWISRRQASAA